jgi:uncharacterized membrane protein SirB2
MNYHDLKFFHFTSIILFSISIFCGIYQTEKKLFKILTGVSSLLLILTGVLLIYRLGIMNQGPVPFWISIKVGIAIAMAVATPIVIKRKPQLASRLFIPYLLLIFTAVFLGIYKPL